MMESIYSKTVLEQGIRVISEKMSQVRSVSLGIWITKGSRNEREEENGISHMIEHMVFKGTKTRTAKDIALSLESLGGHLDAFTSKEETCFYARVLDEHLAEAIDVIADISTNSLFAPEDLNREKKVVIEEIKSLEDAPDEKIHDLFLLTLFPNHPLGNPVLGTIANCEKFRSEDLKNYWKKNYTSDSIIVAAAGNVEHQRLVDLVASSFHFSPSSEKPSPLPLPPETSTIKKIRKEISQVHLCLGRRTIPFHHPDRYALLILNTILGGGMSSRLFQAVRERSGLAYSVFSYVDLYGDTGLWGIYLGTNGEEIPRVLQLLGKEMERFKNFPLEPNELTNAKQQLKGNLMLGLESTSNRMIRLAKLEIYLHGYSTLDETIREIEKVKEEDIQKVASELLDPKYFSLVLLGPLEEEGEQSNMENLLGFA